jgi:hypothetical protein
MQKTCKLVKNDDRTVLYNLVDLSQCVKAGGIEVTIYMNN